MTAAPVTLVVAVDREHLPELEAAAPTWRRYKSGFDEVPKVILHDQWISHPEILRARNCLPGAKLVGWHDPLSQSQRENMLGAFVKAAHEVVDTPYWLKLDTDTLASAPGPLYEPSWLEGEPAIVASPWGYTKPPDAIEKLDAWAVAPERRTKLQKSPLGFRPSPGANACSHARIISWYAIMRTAFTKWAAALLAPGERLPVPSQDTFHWYCAEAGGWLVRKEKMKRHGWEHWGRKRKLEERAREIMAV